MSKRNWFWISILTHLGVAFAMVFIIMARQGSPAPIVFAYYYVFTMIIVAGLTWLFPSSARWMIFGLRLMLFPLKLLQLLGRLALFFLTKMLARLL